MIPAGVFPLQPIGIPFTSPEWAFLVRLTGAKIKRYTTTTVPGHREAADVPCPTKIVPFRANGMCVVWERVERHCLILL